MQTYKTTREGTGKRFCTPLGMVRQQDHWTVPYPSPVALGEAVAEGITVPRQTAAQKSLSAKLLEPKKKASLGLFSQQWGFLGQGTGRIAIESLPTDHGDHG